MAPLKSATNGAAPPHPGLALDLALKDREISQSELSRQSGITFQRINGMVRGRRGITIDSALRIEQAMGLPASDLLTAQAEYDLHRTRAKNAKVLKKIRPFPVVKKETAKT